MRDAALVLIIFGALPFCFRTPWFGILVWSWLAFMNPHMAVWSFAREIPFSMLVGLVTLAGVLTMRDRQPLPPEPEVGLMAAFWGLTVFTTAFANHPDDAWSLFVRVSKILLMTLVTMLVIRTRRQLRYLLLVTAFSIGFYGLKGGIWTLAVGGEGMLAGPESSAIGDNNGIALGLNMVLPMLFFLGREEERRWLRWLLYTTVVFSSIAVLATYSRGGFVGLVVVSTMLLMKTKGKLKLIVPPLALVLAISLVSFMPDRWADRMRGITDQTAEETADGSVQGRFKAWRVGWNLALNNPLLGGGYRAFEYFDAWRPLYPDAEKALNAHSVYFLLLGEHGFTGFLLYFGLMLAVYLSLRRLRHEARQVPGAGWIVDYVAMTRISLIAYTLSAFVYNLAYFDLYFLLVAVTVILKQLLRDAKAQAVLEEEVPESRSQRRFGPAIA